MSNINERLVQAKQVDSASNQYLSFEVNGQMLAVEILKIREIIELGRVTVMPMMQQCISGVINLRGSVVPVVDLSARFSQGKTDINRRTCIVILESQRLGHPQVVGFMVEAVSAVVCIDSESISPPPHFGAGLQTDFLSGIGKVDDEFVLLLNVERLLDFDIPSSFDESIAVESI